MKEIKIKTLRLKNFKGVGSLTIDLNGMNSCIYGKNGARKTTVGDSVSWLFFGKDMLGQQSTGRGAFCIQPRTELGDIVHKLETEVEAVLITESGDEITLGKKFEEKWVRKRKALEKTLEGTVTEYYINGNKKPAGQYQTKVTELLTDEKGFQLATNPTYFLSQMDMKDRRKKIIEICGSSVEISDDDVISTTTGLSNLPAFLGKDTVEEYIIKSKARISQLDKDNADKDVLLDEKMKEQSELNLAVTNPEPIIKKLTDLNEKLKQQNIKISNTRAGGGVTELNLKLTVLEGQLAKITNGHQAKVDGSMQSMRDDLATIKDKIADINSNIKVKVNAKGILETDLKNAKEVHRALLAKWTKVHGSVFTPGESCCTCGALAEHQLNFTVGKFNEQKAKSLEKIEKDGALAAKKVKDLSALLTDETNEILTGEKQKADKEEEREALELKIKNKESEIAPLWMVPEYQEAAISYYKTDLEKLRIESGNTEHIQRVEADKTALEAEIKENEKIIAGIESFQKISDRIDDLKEEKKAISVEYEKLLEGLELTNTFNAAKVSRIEGPVNEIFHPVSFRMFNEAANGSITDACEAVLGGIPYNSLNGAGRIQAGLHCIKILTQHDGISGPVIIDNRESVTEIPEMNSQVVSLIVSPWDETLRVEAA